MATEKVSVQPAGGYGFNTVNAWCKVTPQSGANPTIVSNFGFASIVRTSAGLYTLTLAEPKRFVDGCCDVFGVFGDANFHELEVTGFNVATGVITVTHKTVAYASIASGPTLSDNAGLTSLIVQVTGVAG
jgi:hypothetical protein